MVTKGYDLRNSKLRSKYLTEIPGSKWRALKKAGTFEDSFNKFIYVLEGATAGGGYVTFEWDPELIEPSVFPVLWKQGGSYLDPDPNMFMVMVDRQPTQVTFRVFAYSTATVSGNTVLTDSTIGVNNVWVKALMFHAERTT